MSLFNITPRTMNMPDGKTTEKMIFIPQIDLGGFTAQS